MKLIRQLMIPAVAAFCLTFTACNKSDEKKVEASESETSSEDVQEEPKPRGEEFKLAAKLPANKLVEQQIRIETQVDLTVAGKALPPQQHNVTFDITHDVGEPGEEGAHAIETELVGQTYEFSAGEANWSFDSAQERALDGKNPVFKDLRKAVGGSIKYDVKSEGGTVKLAPSPAFQKSYQAFVKKATRAVQPASKGILAQLYSTHAIARMLLIPNGLPGKAVAEGDTWTASKLDQTPGGVLQAETTYAFEGWSEREGRKVAVLAMNTVYKKPAPRQRAGGGGGGEGSPGGGEPGGGGEAGMDSDPGGGDMDMDSDRESEMDGGSEPGGGDGGESAAAAKPAAPEFGPGELGKASGKIYFDAESGLIVEMVDNQKFQISSSFRNQPRVTRTQVKYLTKIRAIKDPPTAEK